MKKSPKSFVVYGKPTCYFCQKICGLLANLHCPYVFYDVKDDDVRETLHNILQKSQYTVPQVFIGNHHVGGCNDTIEYLQKCIDKKTVMSALTVVETLYEGGHKSGISAYRNIASLIG